MPKGIIVVDVPESCGGCIISANNGFDLFCPVGGMLCGDFEHETSDPVELHRHPDCPIRVLPEDGLGLIRMLLALEHVRQDGNIGAPDTEANRHKQAIARRRLALDTLYALKGLVE